MGFVLLFVFFFGFVAVLICGAAIVGFVVAVYAFRPHLLADVFAVQEVPDSGKRLLTAAIGLVLAAALPMIAGLAYAVSGTKWFVDIFGLAGTYFWAWVAIAFSIGFILG